MNNRELLLRNLKLITLRDVTISDPSDNLLKIKSSRNEIIKIIAKYGMYSIESEMISWRS